MYMILLVLDDPSNLDKVLDAWHAIGSTGATILDSSGMHRQRAASVHMRYLYRNTSFTSKTNLTIMTVVEGMDVVQASLAQVEKVVGDLSNPNTGIFTCWPLTLQKGLPHKGPEAAE